MPAASSNIKFAQGLEKTLLLLSKTNNEAAIDALVPALDSPHQVIQDGALRAVLERRSPQGQREILSRLDAAGPSWHDIIEADKGRMTDALRGGVLGSDPRLCINACQAILWFREYDLAPALIASLEEEGNPRARLAADTLLALTDLLFEDIAASPRDYTGRRDPQLIRQRVVGSLEASVRRFGQHERPEVINAFLLLTHRDNVTLKQILQDPRHGTFVSLIDALLHNQRPGVIQLLLSFLDDPHAPSAAISVLARRGDRKFMRAILRRMKHPPLPIALQNLKRIESWEWLDTEPEELDKLDDAAQAALVQLAIASGMPRSDVFTIIEYLVRQGRPLGRIAAARALSHFNGDEADALVMHALDDTDARVLAAVLGQIRQRGTPGALTRLIEMVEHPQECVRQAAQESLSEFSFDRFVAAFDMLEDGVRRTTGNLVRKINPAAVETLGNEFRTRSRTRRLRALAIADAMNVVTRLESAIVELLCDSDHLVRAEAARALGQCRTNGARQALHDALGDRSISVREAAEQSLIALEANDSGPLKERDSSSALDRGQGVLPERSSHLFRSMGEGFRQKQENFNPLELLLWLALLIGAFVALGMISRYMSRRDKRRFYHSPRGLFLALCRAHELDRASRALLKQLATFHRLAMPAQIFLQPDCLEPSRLGPNFRHQLGRIAALRHKLFGPIQRSSEESTELCLAHEIARQASRLQMELAENLAADSSPLRREAPLAELPLDLGEALKLPGANLAQLPGASDTA